MLQVFLISSGEIPHVQSHVHMHEHSRATYLLLEEINKQIALFSASWVRR